MALEEGGKDTMSMKKQRRDSREPSHLILYFCEDDDDTEPKVKPHALKRGPRATLTNHLDVSGLKNVSELQLFPKP